MVFHKLETYGDQCLQIPVFTGMTGFGAVLRVDGKNDIANRTKSPLCAYVHDLIGMPGWAEGGFETHPYECGSSWREQSGLVWRCLS